MDNFQIETAQNVSIQQNAAGIGERIVAFFLDSLFMMLYFIMIIFLFSLISTYGNDWVSWLILSLPMFLYYLLWETYLDGKTPGKAIMKIRVVRLDGSNPSFSNYLIRWLFRIIDVTLVFGSVAIVTILLKGSGQRLGDIAAGTTVINEKQKVKLNQTILVDIPDDYTALYPQVTVFNDSEIREIKNIFVDAKRDGNYDVILKLSKKVSSLMDVTPKERPMQFISQIIADYNYYTQKM